MDTILITTQNLNPSSFRIYPQLLYKTREGPNYGLKLRQDV